MPALPAQSGLPDTNTAWFFASPLLLALLPLWGGDTAAIFVGKAFGKHLLAPQLSPGKTWEGGIANLVCAVAVAKKPEGSGFLAFAGRGLGSFGGCALFPEQSADLFP